MKKYSVILLTALLILLCACQKPSVSGTASAAPTNSPVPTAEHTPVVTTKTPAPSPIASATPYSGVSPTPNPALAEYEETCTFLKNHLDEFNQMVLNYINEIYYYKGCSAAIGYWPDVVDYINQMKNQPYELAVGISGKKNGFEPYVSVNMIFTTPIIEWDIEYYYMIRLYMDDLKISDVYIWSDLSVEAQYDTFDQYETIGTYTFKIPSNFPRKPTYEGLSADECARIEAAIKHQIDTYEEYPQYSEIWCFPKDDYTVYVLNSTSGERYFLAVTKDSYGSIYIFNGGKDTGPTSDMEIRMFCEEDEIYGWYDLEDVQQTYELIKANAGYVFTYTKK